MDIIILFPLLFCIGLVLLFVLSGLWLLIVLGLAFIAFICAIIAFPFLLPVLLPIIIIYVIITLLRRSKKKCPPLENS